MENSFPNKQSPPLRAEQSFSLQALFLLVTVVAALVSCVDFKKVEKTVDRTLAADPTDVVGAVLLSALLGILMGLGVGLGQIHPLRSAVICCTPGALVAILIMMTCVAPAPPGQACIAVLLPLGIAIFLRYRTK